MGMGGNGSSLSLAHLAGGGPPAMWPPTDTLVVDQSEGGRLSAFLFVDDEEDLIVALAMLSSFISRQTVLSSMRTSLSSTCSR